MATKTNNIPTQNTQNTPANNQEHPTTPERKPSSRTAAPSTRTATSPDAGTYEIIRGRLETQGKELRARLDQLNHARKDVFGAIEQALIGTDRINTPNNCIARDIVTIGEHTLFGYNVHMGLRTEVHLKDVFSVYAFREHAFHPEKLPVLLDDKKFAEDFANLYRYYKDTVFVKFAVIGPHLFMIFQVGKSVRDIKAFKWLIQEDQTLTYLDNRSEHEFRFPNQHGFKWVRAHRDMFREGQHPHVSIMDRVFVETVGGDLTIKVEDNTDSGYGIYAEPVEHQEQTLDDADYYYADLGNIIVLKIRPYQEKEYRYIAYNQKVQEARRINAMEDACVLLPDDHGIIFSNGYYLQTGEFKQFEMGVRDLHFEKMIASPYGEDFLFVFYNQIDGVYVLLSYNLIAQQVENPIICHGYCLFDSGELCYFRREDEPTKHHAVQIWQTPYTGLNFELKVAEKGLIYHIGNKDLVRAMAECHELLSLVQKQDSYQDLYHDLVKKSGEILDAYYWLDKAEAYGLNEPLKAIKASASSAIDEFEKVQRVKKHTREQVKSVSETATALLTQIRRTNYESIDPYVQFLARLRQVRGEVISLKDLRYVELEAVKTLESELETQNGILSKDCVTYLLQDGSLAPYQQKVVEQETAIEQVEKVTQANELGEALTAAATELEMLIDIVSNLKIEDATETTRIIDQISGIYTAYNRVRATLKKKRKSLLSVEGTAGFNSQVKLIDQAVINYLDLCDTPEKCDEYLTKLMVQVEELEGKFSEFDEFIGILAEKREELYAAFETRKVTLVEQRNKRATSLLSAAERMLKGMRNRVTGLESVAAINGYFAADLMVDKVRDLVAQLVELQDSVKADDIQSRLKTLKEDAIRQLKDKQELYVDGENVIRLGKHSFSVNVQPLDLTIVPKDGEMYYHLTGTDFFERITDEAYLATRPVWDQSLVSENGQVYRAEYLADLIRESLIAEGAEVVEALRLKTHAEWVEYVQIFMAPRYHEGYVKGVHDHDAALILRGLLELEAGIGLLRFSPEARACAAVYWLGFAPEEKKEVLNSRLKGMGYILQVFPDSREFGDLIAHLQEGIRDFCANSHLFDPQLAEEAGEYLFQEISRTDEFVISPEAGQLHKSFLAYLKKRKMKSMYNASVKQLAEIPDGRFELIRNWVTAFVQQEGQVELAEYADETASLLFGGHFAAEKVGKASVQREVTGLVGEHPTFEADSFDLHYTHFSRKMVQFRGEVVPRFESFSQLKKELSEQFRSELRLEEFRPRVMASFVRNKLIDEVYLPLIGDNLAKQMGVVGEAKRTDLMGLLLLISPPGYGKTTLMEYVANRLGLIFMKINGPAIGHGVTSLDPAEAPNAAAREEVQKLNLAFEMGDNVMVYLDDIQHLNPEFLQKFISLCDAQRKIEGVYKGKSKTYDLRGRKVCIVMAGNPYTESGEKFRIPDMLSNRADTYNLGDILGDSDTLFNLSYIENCLTSNPVLSKLAGKSSRDLYTLIQWAETGDREGLEFESNHATEDLNAYLSVLKKLFQVRDIIAKVNQAYIHSAAQSEAYRTEPAFKLQGSYRDMNKIAEKVMPILNETELMTLVRSHYENESQTLTTGAEANLLKFKELIGTLTETESGRWTEIKAVFQQNQKVRAAGGDEFGAVVASLAEFTKGLKGIEEVLRNR